MIYKRIKIVFIICCLFFISNPLFAYSYWNNHISYSSNITQIIKNGNIIYALTDGKLFSYNMSDNSFETYIRNNGGNTDIQQIAYNNKNKCMLLIRSDANIEILYEDKSYKDIPYLKNSSLNIDKKINNIYVSEDEAYVAANFGFLLINLNKQEIKESGVFNIPFYSMVLYGDKLYAATSQGVYRIDKTKNFIDFNNWEPYKISVHYTESMNKFEDKSIKQLAVYNNHLVFLVPDTAAYIMEDETSVRTLVANNSLKKIEVTDNNHLLISSKNGCWDYSDLNKFVKLNINDLNYIILNGNSTLEYWMSSEGNNLCEIKRDESGQYSFVEDKRWLKPEGPVSNHPFSLSISNNQLIVTGGGYTNINTERSNIGASVSILKNSRWNNIYPSDITEQSKLNSLDLVYAVSDPQDPNHIFASSWGEGIYEFEGKTLKNRYDKENSPIEEIEVKTESGIWKTTRVGEMVFDKNSNLWMLNSLVENVIKIYQKNGKWAQIYYPDISKNKIETNAKTLIFDKYSNKWVSSIGGGSPYIFIFNDNGTIDNTADDKTKLIDTFIDQSGNNLNINAVFDLKEDLQGNMWVATDIGPFTIKNLNKIFSTPTPVLNKIYVERDGNSNALAPLLENIEIKVLAIDGANRKWIGTETSGLYFIDSNNNSLNHFTINNSPLPSNNILSLAIDDQTGTVYIGSERGLVSYNGGATKGSDTFSNVYAYPNPVRPDYTGPISITGLKENSSVKITDIKGNLINRGKSLGGQYNWDGLNSKGSRVDTGVYIVFGSSEDGSEGVVTKIMIINQ